ncbi:Crp/Fnr family transcriptional regulator [[Clostridium] colinum]|uniref:Crp/Fnr family transcriptional regulator n=1 Tax=[Clostridium] colinum TaxID=36835 RepID=UPI002024A6C4|nr:Crp/Fnr family transcriptional regulator [[Clostridium] colinum]
MLKQDDFNYLEKKLSFWSKITPEEQEQILKESINKKYKKDENIYNPTKECLGIILIKKGELRSYILSEEGKEVTLYRLKEGDICVLSSSCILNNITFDVYIDCEKNTEVIIINSILFSELVNKNVYVENFILKNTVDKFSNVMWTIEQILFMKFDTRLAIFLLDESTKLGTNNIKITHQQIAKYIGSAREVVSRMLKYFEQEDIVKLSRGTIKIIDKEKLKKLI